MYCPKCGTQNDDNNFKCIKCASIIQSLTVSPSPVKETNPVAIVLWIVVPLVVIAMLGMLAAIAIPAYLGYQTKARENIARAQVMAACLMAQELFSQDPNKTITAEDLEKQGFKTKPEIEILIKQGTKENLLIIAKHIEGKKGYAVNKECSVSEITK